MQRCIRFAAWPAFVLLAAGCTQDTAKPRMAAAGSGGMGSGGAASVSAAQGSAGMGGSAVGFEATVQPFIDKACNCHQSSPVLMAPFSLKHGEAYANLVNTPSIQVPSMARIAPGDTNASYLWHKINGTQAEVGGSGQIMPSTIPLNADEKAIFERWITAGAPP